jgi:hypothetical protein
MPIVTWFGHVDNVMPYNGAVVVTINSRVVIEEEAKKDKSYEIAT